MRDKQITENVMRTIEDTAMGVISNCTLEKLCIIEEPVDEWRIEISRYYEGSIEVYDAGHNPMPDALDYGLNAYVNELIFHGFKRTNPHVRIVNAGLSYRPQFFLNAAYCAV